MRYEPEHATRWELVTIEKETRSGDYVLEVGDVVWKKIYWRSGEYSGRWMQYYDYRRPRQRWYQFWRRPLPKPRKSNLPVAKLLTR